MSAIATIEKEAEAIRNRKHESIVPGQQERLNEACAISDGARQGDLYLKIVDAVPAGYVRVEKPKAIDKQLVPGNTEGAKHCLDSFAGVALYRPADWPNAESLIGPCFVLTKERTVLHPVHGAVQIAAGHTVLCSYQREFEAETRKERRNAD